MTLSAMPPNLTLLLEHLNAVRELDRYLRKKGIDKDIKRYISDTLCPAIQELLPELRSWDCEADEEGIKWLPQSWKIDDSPVKLWVYVPNPLDPDNLGLSVNLWASPEWSGYPALNNRRTRLVKTIEDQGFELRCDHHDWTDESVVARFVSWLDPDGSFSEINLIKRITVDVSKIVRLEPEIAEMIKAASRTAAPKKPRLGRNKRSSRRSRNRA
jgi:hypothetical protein